MSRKSMRFFATIFVLFFAGLMIISQNTNEVSAATQNTQTTHFGDFVLTWRWLDMGHWSAYMLERVEGEGLVAIYEYDQNGNRISKNVNGHVTRFIYEEFYGRFYLMREVSEHAELEFLYEIFQGRTGTPFKVLTGVIINSVQFEYSFQYDMIVGLLDPHGNLVALYEYENNGRFVNMTSRNVLLYGSFVNIEAIDLESYIRTGNIAPGSFVRSQNDYALLASFSNIEFNGYADRETGWTINSFGDILDRSIGSFVPRPGTIFTGLSIDSPDSNLIEGELEYEQEPLWDSWIPIAVRDAIEWALSDPSFRRPIPFTQGWFNAVPTDQELITRLIFGEATNTFFQVQGVGWIVRGRMDHSNRNLYGGPTARGVALRSGAFEAITGSQALHSNQSRNPDNSARWFHSVEMAAYTLITGNKENLARYVDRPPGYFSQLYFVARPHFDSAANIRNRNPSHVGNPSTPYTGSTGQIQWGGIRFNFSNAHSLGHAGGNVFFHVPR